MANPFMEHLSFDDFMKKYSGGTAEQVQRKIEQKEINVKVEVEKADKMLKNFKPDKKRKKGGRK